MVLIGEPAEGAARRRPGRGLDEKLKAALARHSIKDAAALVAAEPGCPRREVYARALALAKDRP